MLNRGALSLLFILGFLVIITSWYSVKASTIVPLSIATIAQTGKLEQGEIIQTNDQGLIAYQATVTDATQTGQGLIYFSNLVAKSYDSDRTPWLLSADQGLVLQGNEEITLNGHVQLVHPATSSNPQVTFATTSASIFPKTQKITGDDWITVSEGGSRNVLTGKGFTADMKSKTMQMLSQVKGIYYAQP